MRVAMLAGGMSPYMRRCLDELQASGHDVFVCHGVDRDRNAPYSPSTFAREGLSLTWTDQPDEPQLRRTLAAFAPDALLVISWHYPFYRRLLREWRGRAVRVLCMDNQWRSTPKQWLGRATWRQYLAPLYDMAFVPGYRQEWFARRLGFRDEDIIRGLYAADRDGFDLGERQTTGGSRSFLFTGRLVPEKGTDILAAAYAGYRKRSADPWSLRVLGTGPHREQLANVEGVEMLGFRQPDELPTVFRESICLLLPSRFEPWGVVVHEACAAGMGVVASTAVGAADTFVQDGYNGRIVGTGSVRDLGAAMLEVSRKPESELLRWSGRSRGMSHRLTPQLWVEQLTNRVGSRLGPERTS